MAIGFCPICNSDAPKVDTCPLCNGYSSANGDDFPPSRATKNRWLDDYKMVVRLKKVTLKAILKSLINKQ